MGIACAAVILAMAFIPGLLTTQHAVVETAGGGLHRVFEKNAASLKAGDTVSLGDTVRTTGVTSAVLRLNDGSRIEVRANSELTLEKASDGIRIRLKEGDILVEAAKQGSSHLYVQTKEVTVAVVGTVFLVKAEVEGSRVAVLEGQVLVQQGSTSKKLLQGEEVSTNSKMESRPVSEELSWSRRAETHMAQAQQPALPPPVPSERLEFEAVSLKPEAPTGPIPPDEPGYGGGGPECLGIDGRFGTLVFIGAPLGRCVGRHVSLMWMIDAAYGLGNNAPTRIVQTGYSDPGGRSMQFEPWISNLWDNGFSLDAKAENPLTTTKDQLQQMLQSMLAERFKLSITREMRPVRELGLIVARGGPKLQQAPAGSEENVRFTQNVSGGVRQIARSLGSTRPGRDSAETGVRLQVLLPLRAPARVCL